MSRITRTVGGVLLAVGAINIAKTYYNFSTTPPPATDTDFEPAKMPSKIDMQVEGSEHAMKTLYHLFGAAWWSAKRSLANEKMRQHTMYFQHETEVTQFKRELDDEV